MKRVQSHDKEECVVGSSSAWPSYFLSCANKKVNHLLLHHALFITCSTEHVSTTAPPAAGGGVMAASAAFPFPANPPVLASLAAAGAFWKTSQRPWSGSLPKEHAAQVQSSRGPSNAASATAAGR